MKKVAKLVIIDPDGKYLLMQRNNHPTFGMDPDLPGGTLEDGEAPLQTMLREVQEETSVIINPDDVHEVYSGVEYSAHGTHYTLFVMNTDFRPEIVTSWEHCTYEWLGRDEFLQKSKKANDTYMQMACDVLKSIEQ